MQSVNGPLFHDRLNHGFYTAVRNRAVESAVKDIAGILNIDR